MYALERRYFERVKESSAYSVTKQQIRDILEEDRPEVAAIYICVFFGAGLLSWQVCPLG